ncbi:P-loop containing nucleoside triphosphate hydrolase protein [Vararia minispora EC-137]|uniref:P-loop containing nucleoside triphosphate hydrolase protein n=1 Tax=Vararia minispora EC-137 TaxID=1314806 RepID=A0ACB8QFU3_9AGAM|nr:P-loop containing nucleoside triphosphate hydrolase protein [Vararia minispora EC-137]
MANSRTARLKRLFDSITRGTQDISPQSYAHFVEATCTQLNPLVCLDRLTSNPKALDALQKAIFSQLSVPFLNGMGAKVFQLLQTPALADVAGGALLNKVLLKLSTPQFLLNAYKDALLQGQLDLAGQQAFAWLVRQLVNLPSDPSSKSFRDLASDVLPALFASSFHDVKSLGQAIERSLGTYSSSTHGGTTHGPGGRHDNDFEDFRKIAILPTAEEIKCLKPPYILSALAVEDIVPDERPSTHIDNQFRLLREDMVYEIREELQKTFGKSKEKRFRGFLLENFKPVGIYTGGASTRTTKWGLQVECQDDLWFFVRDKVKPEKRRQYLMDDKRLVKHQSLACLLVDNEAVALATIHRDEDLLSRPKPIVVLQFDSENATRDVLVRFKAAKNTKLIQVDTPVFAYEPVLKSLQSMPLPSLSPDLFLWDDDQPLEPPPIIPQSIIRRLENDPKCDLGPLLGLKKTVILDSAQATSLLAALQQRVSLIQGPPGTGKSFIGALVAKILHDKSEQRILVCCFTNHALDQFLEDLLDVGIPQSSMVRLGGKSTPRTEPLSLYNQQPVSRFSPNDNSDIADYRSMVQMLSTNLQTEYAAYDAAVLSDTELLALVEFEDADFFEAFSAPSRANEDGMKLVGRTGKDLDDLYLVRQWRNGDGAGVFKKDVLRASKRTQAIWKMDKSARRERLAAWQASILQEKIQALYDVGARYNQTQDKLDRKFEERNLAILRSKRIIGCTTTGAAKHMKTVQAARPDVLIVEEAGEILESHVLTALGESSSQLCLIGDHLQLRPKVNNYALTLEKGDGFELNVSLFERLINSGYPHQTLQKQHRMRPEISEMIRHLTYPDLVDAETTNNRPGLLGVQDNVVFITHSHPEDELKNVADLRDGGAKSSKQNEFEVKMVLKIVRYLAQQGYSSGDVVILTPYLGQLFKLKNALKHDTDPYLSDMDLYDLVRAGLVDAGTAKLNKKPLRLSTIDNYQGEEKGIVIISLTRSNAAHDIGFLFSPERLNVLLSRARDACIIIGNAETFRGSRKGGALWTRFFEFITDRGHFYEGFPIFCERHPDRTAVLKEPEDFNELSPDGGCQEPCGVTLNCGAHKCPSRCHNLSDHSKVRCEKPVKHTCPKGHTLQYKCANGPPATCKTCDKEARKEAERLKRAFEAQQERERQEQEHERRLAEVQKELDTQHRAIHEEELRRDRETALRNKQEELENAKRRLAQKRTQPTPTILNPSTHNLTGAQANAPRQPPLQNPAPPAVMRSTVMQPTDSVLATPLPDSPSQLKWERQKSLDGAFSKHIDALTAMTGLESVKAKVLSIRDQIELSKRQGKSMSDERFNVSLLGNPGTGKTTVARLYARFLASIDLLPGDAFVETTGSLLSNEGITGAKKHIDFVHNQGGGAIFIDEAYQLVSEKNFGGGQVLDYLLAEMENNVGKMVFILAGYSKEMEKFFEHNPGIPSRVPHTLYFDDYTDHELIHMFEAYVAKKYEGRMKIEDGTRGLYARIAIRRLGRGRGRPGFGNARAMQNMYMHISERQAIRIEKERKAGLVVDDLLFTMEDMIGPDPSIAIAQSKAWAKLKEMIGLCSVKDSVEELAGVIGTNYHRELQEKNPLEMSLNRVFLGNPGTGKTTVAKLYGQILADLGMLSNGEVVVKNPSDFKGQYIGQSEANTKGILKSTLGKVLVIDEAYMLYKGGSSNDNGLGHQDIFGTSVIDTLVAEVQSVPGDDRCVLLLGYEGPMREMFQNVNPGFSRRFAIEDAFQFEDFNEPELLQILELKMKQQDIDASSAGKNTALDVLSRARSRPNFGNGGEVENLLGKAKVRCQGRQAKVPPSQRVLFLEPIDFDPDFDRLSNSAVNLTKLFEDVVDSDKVVAKLETYQNVARKLKARGTEPRKAHDLIPTTFIFKGPPGTGKTTTARKMGQVYYDMGFLSSSEVIECSASDLVGQYVGHTGPKTRKLFEKALGKVLFIDEAYRLGSQGKFAQEAVDELVGLLTHEDFRGKLIVVLAGYDKDMDQLLTVNTGLASRFTEEIIFPHFSPQRCFDILAMQVKKENIQAPELEQSTSTTAQELVDIFKKLCRLPSWGNARDVTTLSRTIVRKTINADASSGGDSPLRLRWTDVLSSAREMLRDKRARLPKESGHSWLGNEDDDLPTLDSSPEPPAAAVTSSTDTSSFPPSSNEGSSDLSSPAELKSDSSRPPSSLALLDNLPLLAPEDMERDHDVSDTVWQQLQIDKQAQRDVERHAHEEQERLAAELATAHEREKEEKNRAIALQRKAAEDAKAAKELEEQRQRKIAAQREKQRIMKALEEARKQEEERKRREAEAQKKLRQMGICPAGFQWIPQGGGYRCSAGGHYVSNSQLGL